MFPRFSRLMRLVVVIFVLLVLFIFLVPRSAPGSSGAGSGSALIYLPHLPSPAFQGPLAPSRGMTTPKATTAGKPKANVTTAAKGQDPDHRQEGQGQQASQKRLSLFEGQEVLNPHHFRYVLNPAYSICQPGRASNSSSQGKGQGNIELLVYVHSAPKNFKKRQSIRETWGDKDLLAKYNASVVFIMGHLEDDKLMNLVKQESEQYGDVVQEDFLDSYRNLTYKAIAGLKWAATYCSNVPYILKSDDDMLVNIHRVVKHLHAVVVPQYGQERLILCNVWLRMKIIRDKKSKWYVPEEEFPGDLFPPYCSGAAFLLSGDMAWMMYQASRVTKFFWVDDYYVTGALIKTLQVKHKRLNQAYILNPLVAEGKFINDTKKELFFFHLHKLRLLYQLWTNMTEEAHSEAVPAATELPVALKILQAGRAAAMKPAASGIVIQTIKRQHVRRSVAHQAQHFDKTDAAVSIAARRKENIRDGVIARDGESLAERSAREGLVDIVTKDSERTSSVSLKHPAKGGVRKLTSHDQLHSDIDLTNWRKAKTLSNKVFDPIMKVDDTDLHFQDISVWSNAHEQDISAQLAVDQQFIAGLEAEQQVVTGAFVPQQTLNARSASSGPQRELDDLTGAAPEHAQRQRHR